MTEIIIKIEAHELSLAITALAEAIGWQTAANTGAIKQPAAVVNPAIPPPTQPQPELVAPEAVATITLDEAKKRIATIVKIKGSEALKAILAEYGAGKVSEVPADKLADLLGRMEAL